MNHKKCDMIIMRHSAAFINQFQFAGCLYSSVSISSQFTIEVWAAAENRQKSQNSRSSILIPLKACHQCMLW